METLARAANRGSIATGAEGYTIDNSFVQEYNSTRTVEVIYGGFGGNEPTTTKGTISFWFKWGALNGGGAVWKLLNVYNSQVSIMPEGGTYDSSIYVAVYNEAVLKLVSTAKFRDTSAWYHICAVFDTTLSTASDRVKIYINGVRITDWSTANYPSQNADLLLVKENTKHFAGHNVNAGKPYGYYADMYYIHNQAKDVTDFGEFDADTGIWKPIEYTGTFGSYGYHWDFSNASNLAEDQSGNDASTNQMSCSAFNVTSSMQSTDTPTNNFATCTYGAFPGNTNLTITEGGTKVTTVSGGLVQYDMNFSWYSNILAPYNSGKWYIEVYVTNQDASVFGIAPNQGSILAAPNNNWDRRVFLYNGSVNYNYGTSSGVDSSRFTFTTGDILMAVIDADNQRVTFGKNGGWMDTSSGVTNSSPTVWYTYSGGDWDEYGGFVGFYGTTALTNANPDWEVNHGGYHTYTISSAETDANGYGTFEYAPPTGYYALCTKNLAQYG